MKKFIVLLVILLTCVTYSQELSWSWSHKMLGTTDTLTTRIDSVVNMFSSGDSTFANLGFGAWIQGQIVTDDTLELSTSASFTNAIKILPNTSLRPFELPKLDVSQITNLYIRRFVISGGTGTVNIILKIFGI